MRKWIIVVLIILVGIGFAAISMISRELGECRRDARIEQGLLQSARDSLFATREQLKEKYEEGESHGGPGLQEPQQLQGGHIHLLDNYQIKKLKDQGLSDPVKQITIDLMAHPELIPIEGVLGGTMGFCCPENITILSPFWVFARFEDGHVMGSCLLEYEISPDTTIHWKVIEARLDE